MYMLAFQSRFIGGLLEFPNSFFLILCRLARHSMLVNIHNEFIELPVARVLVRLLLPTFVSLDHEAGRVFRMVSGGENAFVQGCRNTL